MTLLVDDQVLSLLLRGEPPAPLVGTGDAIFTTGYWYVRLCQAVLGVADRPGALSSPFASLPPEGRDQSLAAVLELPERSAFSACVRRPLSSLASEPDTS